MRELNKAEALPSHGQRNSKPHSKLSLQERIQLETVSEKVRLQFLDHELRARRFKLLSRIYRQEDDLKVWREDVKTWLLRREACHAVGAELAEPSPFSWPPIRPSYLPPDHPPHESKGRPCPPGCLGRQGDKEILAMWRSARRNPHGGGWTEIPKMQTRKDKNRSNQGRRGQPKGAQEGDTSLFGEASPEDLRKWNADWDSLPGLTSVVDFL